MAERDWTAIASEYIEGEGSLRALAERHAIPWSTLRDRARRESWETRRREMRAANAENSFRGERPAPHEKPFRDDTAAPYEKPFRDDTAAPHEKPFRDGSAASHEKDAERIFRVTDKLIQRAEEILDSGGEVGARELGELMRAIKNAKEIKMLRSALDEREQQARVQALEEKHEEAKSGTLRIEFSPEAEEAAL